MAIPLGRRLPAASRDLPGRGPETALARGCPWAARPYSVLLPVGFSLPVPLPVPRCALTAPFHPCPARGRTPGRAVSFLWHCPWGRPRRALPGTVFPWSPDFPPPAPCGVESGHPAVCRQIYRQRPPLPQGTRQLTLVRASTDCGRRSTMTATPTRVRSPPSAKIQVTGSPRKTMPEATPNTGTSKVKGIVCPTE
jgi:hypothetical protein